MEDRLEKYLRFIREVERLKSVERTAWTTSGRRESTAEHSWRLALLAMVLCGEYPRLDRLRVLQLALVHDLGETYDGDIPAVAQGDPAAKERVERAAVERLAGCLPEGAGRELRGVWEEYEACRTPEAKLVKALDKVEGIERYRISSIEPNLLTDEIIEYVSRSRRFMPHFHIPLQSGSDEVLKLMRRRYDTALFASKIKKIKEVMPDSFIGVDVIVGTRGETEEYFGQAYEFIKSLDVTQLHVFSYSERPGTQALKIDHVVAPEEKHRRSQQLLELSDEKTRAFYARHIGQTMPVLLERPKPGLPMHGFTPNYIRVEVPHDAALDNQLVSVRLGDFNADGTALLGAME